MTIYPAVDAGVPARSSARDVVLMLKKDQLDNIVKQVAAVRKARPVVPAAPKAGAKPAA